MADKNLAFGAVINSTLNVTRYLSHSLHLPLDGQFPHTIDASARPSVRPLLLRQDAAATQASAPSKCQVGSSFGEVRLS